MKKNILAITLLLSAINALACTGFVAGKNATADGSMIIARNEDFGSGSNPKTFVVRQAKVNKKGEKFVNPDTGFETMLPKKSFRYTLVPDADPSYGVFGEAGTNEHGVTVSTTVSASANDEILKIDPYVQNGITEPDMASLILMQAKTAREGVEIIAKIIDKQGTGEGNVIFIADQNEIWYMEMYTGHQYVAVKVPDDMYAVIGNAHYLSYVDLDSKDVIHSKDILKLPKDNKLLKEKDGKFHLAMTYGEPLSPYNQIRIWAGQNRFNPSDKLEYDVNHVFEVFRKPEQKIKLKDVMNVFRDRYEGTKYYNDTANYRPIGINTNLESHIFQIKQNLPKEAPAIMWLAMGPVEHSVYIPYFSLLGNTAKVLRNTSQEYDQNSYYWVMKHINMIASTDRVDLGQGVKNYWSGLEDQFIKNQTEKEMKFIDLYKSNPKAALKYATYDGIKTTKETISKAKKLENALVTFASRKNEHKKYKAPFEFKNEK